eukprot:7655503-Pyramimonas_sp.AAC.1
MISDADQCANEGARKGQMISQEIEAARAADTFQEKMLLRPLVIQRAVFLISTREVLNRKGLVAA